MTVWHTAAIWLTVPLLLASLWLPPIPIKQPVYALQLTFDISQSMQVTDGNPNNTSTTRLTQAKLSARHLLAELKCGSTAGLSAFTGKRSLILLTPVEVCEHYDALVQALEQVNGKMRWENASRVGKGLQQSLRAASTVTETTGTPTAVIFYTDGHEAPPLREGESGLPKMPDEPRTGIVVGVGGSTPQRIPKFDTAGNMIGFWQASEVVQRPAGSGTSQEELSSLFEAHLQRLAQGAGISYTRLDPNESLYRTLQDNLSARTVDSPTDVRWVPAVLALLLLVWRFSPH